jgi:hypothetical protein
MRILTECKQRLIGLVLFLSCTFCGCASYYTADWQQRIYEPVKGGHLVLRDGGGGDYEINSRRRDALKKMATYCGTLGYTIVQEGREQPRIEKITLLPIGGGGSGYNLNPGTTVELQRRDYSILFRCGKKERKVGARTVSQPDGSYFTVGSTSEEVLAIQGRPTRELSSGAITTWWYGPAWIKFEAGRVTEWRAYGPDKLKAHGSQP